MNVKTVSEVLKILGTIPSEEFRIETNPFLNLIYGPSKTTSHTVSRTKISPPENNENINSLMNNNKFLFNVIADIKTNQKSKDQQPIQEIKTKVQRPKT